MAAKGKKKPKTPTTKSNKQPGTLISALTPAWHEAGSDVQIAASMRKAAKGWLAPRLGSGPIS